MSAPAEKSGLGDETEAKDGVDQSCCTDSQEGGRKQASSNGGAIAIPATVNELSMADAFRYYRDVLGWQVYPADGPKSKKAGAGKKPSVTKPWEYDPQDCDGTKWFNGAAATISVSPRATILWLSIWTPSLIRAKASKRSARSGQNCSRRPGTGRGAASMWCIVAAICRSGNIQTHSLTTTRSRVRYRLLSARSFSTQTIRTWCCRLRFTRLMSQNLTLIL